MTKFMSATKAPWVLSLAEVFESVLNLHKPTLTDICTHHSQRKSTAELGIVNYEG